MIKESAEWAKLAISRAISVWGSSQLAYPVINYLHAFGCVEVGRGIACVKLSPWSDNRRYLFEGPQVVTNSCMHHLQCITDLCMSTIKSGMFQNASLTFAWAPLSPVLSRGRS
jgi:hypothetical protein